MIYPLMLVETGKLMMLWRKEQNMSEQRVYDKASEVFISKDYRRNY